MNRIRSVFRQMFSFLFMLLTLRPSLKKGPRIKVLGRPFFQGGPATKYGQLESILASNTAPFSTVLCLSSVSTPLFLLKALKALGARILVNQNGVYYPAWFPKGWQRKNAYLRRLNALADHSFFQSEFALQSYRRWVGEPPVNRSILYNAVDTKRFYPADKGQVERLREHSSAIRVLVFMDVSEFTKPVWEHVLGFRAPVPPRTNDVFEWVYVGRVHDTKIAKELGVSPCAGDIPSLLRDCDVALHLVYNDVCPNKVLECMASGVWVIGTSAGGTAELLGDGGTVLTVNDGYETPEYPSYEGLQAALTDFVRHRAEYRQRAIARAQKFRLEDWLRTVEEA